MGRYHRWIGKRTGKRVISWLVIFILLLGAAGNMGCGSKGNGAENGQGENGGNVPGSEETEEQKNKDEETVGETGEKESGEKAMGRYVETMNESMADFAGAGSRMARQADGSLMLFSPGSGKWVSKDNGATWEPESLAWFSEMRAKEDYIMDIAVSVDGSVGIIYCEKESSSDEKSGNTESGGDAEAEEDAARKAEQKAEGGRDAEDEPEQEADIEKETDSRKGADSGQETEPVIAESEDGEADGMSVGSTLHPKYRVVSADNEITEFEIPGENGGYLHRLCFSGDGRLFGAAMGGKIYEIDWKQGEQKVVAEWEELLYHIAVWEDKMAAVSGSGVKVFDLESGEVIADKVLDEFMETQMGDKLVLASVDVLPMLLIPGGDDILYLVCEKGIYRHVLGGNVVEQLADGALNSLGSPSYGIGDGVLLEDNVFLVLFTNGNLADYAYDPDMPATPDIWLKAYSLTESGRLKQAIAAYQAGHPEVYIRYEIGMDGNTSATKDDALKKLNMEIAAGNGPDLLLLDDMPMDSYVEKGVLADLTPYLESMTEDMYFQNILRAFETEGKIYAVPTEFILPVAGGKKEDVEQMKDLTAIAEIVERYRKEKPEGGILGWTREKDMLWQFFWTCAPVWENEDGSVNGEKLEEFFVQVKRIWDAEEEGITDEMRKEVDDFYAELISEGRTEEELKQFRINHIGWTGDQYMLGEQEFFMGGINAGTVFDMTISYFRIKEKADGDFAAYGGQASGVFVPQGIAGISQTSEHPEIAAGLLETLLEENNWSGLSLNKEQLRKDLSKNATEDGSSYASTSAMSQDGTYTHLEIYPASEEEIDRLLELVEQVKVPYKKNEILEDAVCEAGVKVLKDEITAREGVQEVMNRVSLYLAE